MKQNYFKFVFLSLLMMVVGNVGAFGAQDVTWVKTAPADLATGDVVMIVDLGSNRAMSNDKGTSSAPEAVYIYYTDDEKTESTGTKDNVVPASLQWEVAVDNSSYKFGVSGTSNYLYCTNTNNGVRVGTNSNNAFTLSVSSDNYYLKNTATSRYVGVYNSQDWRCYTSTTTNISNTQTAFYKKVTTVSDKTLQGLMISGYPTEFYVGDEFTFGEEGTVTAVYDDNSTKVVTQKCQFSEPDMSTSGTKTVTVSYTEGEVTKTTTYNITVKDRTLESIEVSGQKTEFNVGEEFTFGGTVTAIYDDESTKDVTSKATFDGYSTEIAGELPVTVSYTEGEVTKTATYNITVSEVAVTGLSLDPTEATILVGKTKTLTATVTPENATDKSVVWSSNNENVATVADGVVTAVAAGTAIITVATPDGAQTATCNVTVKELKTETFTLVEDASTLAEGDEVIIVNTEYAKAMSTTQNSNNRGAADVTVQDKEVLVPNSGEIQVFTLEGDAEGWYFNTGSGYIYAASSSNNYLRTEEAIDNNGNAKAIIEIDDLSNATITFQGTNNRNILQYNPNTNNNNPLFSCYGYASQSPVQIYKKGESVSPTKVLTGLTLSGEFTTTFYVGDEFSFEGTVTATYDDESTKNVTSKATFTEPDMSTAGEQTITVSYTEGEVTKTAEYTINVREAETVKFRKVSSADDLVDGKRYVLVNEENKVVMAACSAPSSSTSVFTKFDTVISDEHVTLVEGQANFLTLGGEEGAWTFATSIETNKYLAYTGSGNYLESGASAETASAQWTITFDEQGNAAIQNKNNTDRFIMYNKQQPRFACYTGTQQPVQLYVESDLEDVTLTISSVGYATLYYSDRALKVPEGVTAKTYKVVNGKLAESKKYEASSKIPKGEAVVLKGAPGDYTFKVTSTAESKDAYNQLKGSDAEETTTGGTYYYALQAKAADGSGGPGLYWMKENGAAFTNGAHKAYMALDEQFAEVQGMAKSFYLFEDATGIGSAQADGEAAKMKRFNMSGQRVGSNYKGIVIVNGKKIVIK